MHSQGQSRRICGLAQGGASGYGLVFELVPSASGWTENVLYYFDQSTAYVAPNSLLQDQYLNLYGLGYVYVQQDQNFSINAIVYKLSPSRSTFDTLTIIQASTFNSQVFANLLAIDSQQDVYIYDSTLLHLRVLAAMGLERDIRGGARGRIPDEGSAGTGFLGRRRRGRRGKQYLRSWSLRRLRRGHCVGARA